MNFNISVPSGGQPNLDPLRNIDTGGKGKIDLSQEVSNAATLDPTKTDSVTAFETISNQNVRITGKIEINRTPDGYKVTISLDPGDPELANSNNNGQVNSKAGWFAPSFIAAFTNVMSEVLSNLRKIGWMEAQTERQVRTQIFDMALNQADLIRSDYALQSREAQLQAIQSFTSAAISTVQFASTISNSNKAKAEADAHYGKDLKAAQKEVDVYYDKDPKTGKLTMKDPDIALTSNLEDLKTAADTTKTKADLSQGIVDSEVAAGRTPTPEQKKQALDDAAAAKDAKVKYETEKNRLDSGMEKAIEQWEAKAEAAKDNLAKVQGERDTAYFSRLKHLDDKTNTIAQILNSAVQGAMKTVESGIKTQQGEINAEKTILQSLMEMLNKYGENSAKHRDEAKRSFSEYVSALQQTVHSDIQAHMSR